MGNIEEKKSGDQDYNLRLNNLLKKFELRTERSTKNKPTQMSVFLVIE
jgi:hypothetical protein